MVATILLILLIGLIRKLFRQPHVVACLVMGILIGSFGFEVLTNTEAIGRMVISLSLLVSPLWMTTGKNILKWGGEKTQVESEL